MLIDSPLESCFYTSRRFNGLPATVSKYKNCILFVEGNRFTRESWRGSSEKVWQPLVCWMIMLMLRAWVDEFMNEIVKLWVKMCPWKENASDYKIFLIFLTLSEIYSYCFRRVCFLRAQLEAERLNLFKEFSGRRTLKICWKILIHYSHLHRPKAKSKSFNKIRRRERQNETAYRSMCFTLCSTDKHEALTSK